MNANLMVPCVNQKMVMICVYQKSKHVPTIHLTLYTENIQPNKIKIKIYLLLMLCYIKSLRKINPQTTIKTKYHILDREHQTEQVHNIVEFIVLIHKTNLLTNGVHNIVPSPNKQVIQRNSRKNGQANSKIEKASRVIH